MIRSLIFSDGKLVGQDLEIEALRLVRADKGLVLWVDLDDPTPEEIRLVLEVVFQFHPLAIEDCVQPNSLPKVEDYEDYLFIVTHAVDFTRTDKFNTTELDQIDFTQVHETSIDTVRKNLDETLTFVKWDGETPSSVVSLTTKEGPYTYEEILNILATEEWTDPNPMMEA
jgi:Mg2+ and Co2+ transporter CorA